MSTNDLVLGGLALVIGLVFCFFGAKILRIAITLWGALIGFVVGAALANSWFDGGVLATATAWLIALTLAVIFGVLAYIYYVVAVALAVGAFGFAVSMSIFFALNDNAGVPAVLVSIAVGSVLAVLTIVLHLPLGLLVFVSAIDGATAAVTGAGFLLGLTSIKTGLASLIALDNGWLTTLAALALAILGMVFQSRNLKGSYRTADAWN